MPVNARNNPPTRMTGLGMSWKTPTAAVSHFTRSVTMGTKSVPIVTSSPLNAEPSSFSATFSA